MKRVLVAVACIALPAVASASGFKPICGQADMIKSVMQNDHGQSQVLKGVDSGGLTWSVWEDAQHNFSILVDTSGNTTCIEAMGQNLTMSQQP